ncbi:MAG: membrane protein insertion efficiency factor YidD [Candidatus Yanofskybacteria bacterium CG10_big_fil_rev_8_21_14_0_10_46_23]|uniref:Putative membrane protein insertion efficiency factor n=1 Tax=Candidatus Yanofskybacteria bacterium CG10_big_fil_rev_8_21_14_0_10_46_23 TaxID=1975098 RepID=A0A2H0R4D4_9BACT|nr:MAG: membrane protein insertion efficiency factor YidD [Candidatus Yanofskybacteria bacterium CG10_big_fil_rev_8_21_14_0_10_46_23]
MKKVLIKIIDLYQKYFSPDHGCLPTNPHTGCRFYPSCSQYTKEAIVRKGPVRGLIWGCWRILRCNPLARGGIDLVR